MAEMNFNIYAMDCNSICLQLTRQKMEQIKYNKITYIQNERMKINLSDNSLDGIVAWGALVFFNEQERREFTKEIYRVLKPGGLLLANYRTKEDSLYGKGTEIEKNLFCLNDNIEDVGKMIYWFCEKEDLNELYTQNGFEIFNLEKKTFKINNMSIINSYFHIWIRKK